MNENYEENIEEKIKQLNIGNANKNNEKLEKESEEDEISPGLKLADYKKENYLGHGAYGNVYRYTNIHVKKHVAVKEIMLGKEDLSKHVIKTLKNEIDILCKVGNHLRTVGYIGAIKDSEVFYIFMEYVEGGTLETVLRKGPFEPEIIAKYSKQILEGLDFLHRKNIMHRDIKCANILRGLDDNIKLCDFGVSKCLQSLSSGTIHERIKKGLKHTCCGSPYWMAPEVINSEPYDVWADVWSLGATVIEMATGDHPYPGLSAMQALYRIGMERKINYKSNKNIPKEVEIFIDQMLVSDPQLRASVDTLLRSSFIRGYSQKIKDGFEMKEKSQYDYDINSTLSLNDYTKKDILERGKFGKIHKWVDNQSKRVVVAKEILFSLNNKDRTFIEEEICVWKDYHPRIVQYLGYFRDHKNIYIFMEFMKGGSIKTYLNANGPLGVSSVRRYSLQILEGLNFLHQYNIVYRHMRSSNIMRDLHDNVKLKCVFTEVFNKAEDSGMETMSSSDMSLWLAPEIITDGYYSFSSDVWSLGITILEMLTGSHPYSNLSTFLWLSKLIQNKKFEYECPSTIPAELRTLIDSMLAYNREERPTVNSLLESKFFCDIEKRDEIQYDQFNKDFFKKNKDEYLSSCMTDMGFDIVDQEDSISKTKWFEYIKEKMESNLIGDTKLENIFEVLKEIKSNNKEDMKESNEKDNVEYFTEVSILFIHMRIFGTKSEKEILSDKEKSLEFLEKILSERQKILENNCEKTHIKCWPNLLKGMVDLLEDVTDQCNHPMVNVVLPFLGYCSLFEGYDYERDINFLETYLHEECSSRIWSAVILSLLVKGHTSEDIVLEYLNNVVMDNYELTEDIIAVYMVNLEIKKKSGKKMILTYMDNKMIQGMHKLGRLSKFIKSKIVFTIIKVFNDMHKTKIFNTAGGSFSDSDNLAIECLSLSLKGSLAEDHIPKKEEILDFMFSWLEDASPFLMDNPAVWRIAAIILYEMYEYKIYLSKNYKEKLQNLCNKYLTMGKTNKELELSSSVLLCCTGGYNALPSNFGFAVTNLEETLKRMMKRKVEVFFKFSFKEIKEAFSKGETIMRAQANSTSCSPFCAEDKEKRKMSTDEDFEYLSL